jgi:hypothetical protein
MAKTRRVVMRLELTGPAKTKLDGLCDTTGMTQVQLMSRLLEWFTDQPELIQAAALGRYPPEIQEDLAKLIMKRMQIPLTDAPRSN